MVSGCKKYKNLKNFSREIKIFRENIFFIRNNKFLNFSCSTVFKYIMLQDEKHNKYQQGIINNSCLIKGKFKHREKITYVDTYTIKYIWSRI